MISTGEIWTWNKVEQTQSMLKYGIAYALPFGLVGLFSFYTYEKLQ